MKRTIILFISLLGVLLIILAFIYASNRAVLAPGENQNSKTGNNVQQNVSQKEAELPKPTGRVDDVISAAAAGVASEDNLLKEEESSANSAVNESSEVSSFGQSYDENEL